MYVFHLELRKKKEKAINESNYEQIFTYCKDLGDEYLKQEEYEEALVEYKVLVNFIYDTFKVIVL